MLKTTAATDAEIKAFLKQNPVSATESKKRMEDGVFVKHKIFLYKEDFEKFSEGLLDTVEYIKANQEVIERKYEDYNPAASSSPDIDFEI